ncbi:MAG: hypothetical protein BWZ02_00538 [Lentisphaerae bacterium ADurb.BinA184]|nr:MAG: hypothetical protein BWZ02_00538 [Lentisphaerae bacterium ADurb.BinA184]
MSMRSTRLGVSAAVLLCVGGTAASGAVNLPVFNGDFRTVWKSATVHTTGVLNGWVLGNTTLPDAVVAGGSTITWEGDPNPGGGGTTAYIPGWAAVTSGNETINFPGVQRQSNPEGVAYLMTNSPGWGGPTDATATTSLPIANIAAGADYTLSVRVAYGDGIPGTMVVELLAGGATLTPTGSVTPALQDRSFVTWTFTYDAASLASQVGQPLAVALGIANGISGVGGQFQFTDVQILATLIPEPATLVLAGLAMSATLCRRRR